MGKKPITNYISAETIDGCWNWIGSNTSRGYGRIRHENRLIYAHRYIYELMIGKIPDGLFICHKCNNPACVNPGHLYAGTQKQNMADRENRYKAGEIKRPYITQNFCMYGHEYTKDNTANWGGQRYCRTCQREKRY